jgi:hypothetical protein
MRTTDVIMMCALTPTELDSGPPTVSDAESSAIDFHKLGKFGNCARHKLAFFPSHCDPPPGQRFQRPHHAHFIHSQATAANPHHDRNYLAFTLDFPDANKPSLGVTIHPLSQCFCRYLIIISHGIIVTLPVFPHSNADADEHPFNELRKGAQQSQFNGALAAAPAKEAICVFET